MTGIWTQVLTITSPALYSIVLSRYPYFALGFLSKAGYPSDCNIFALKSARNLQSAEFVIQQQRAAQMIQSYVFMQ